MSARSTGDDVLTQWDEWMATITDRLIDLDERSSAGDSAVRLDLAAGFVCRKAVAARIEQIRAGGDAADLAAEPLVDEQGAPVAPDLAAAATLLAAIVDRVDHAVSTVEVGQRAVAADLAAATTDAAVADRLASELGQFVARAATARQRLSAAGRDPQALHAAAVELAALRADLDAQVRHRDDLFRRWADVAAVTARLREREHEVRSIVERCQEKVRPLPTLAMPSIDALGEPEPLESLRALPWPAARVTMEERLGRLDRLGAAYDEIAERHLAVLRRRDGLRGLLHAFRAKAGASSLAESPTLEQAFRGAESELWSAPCDVDRAEPLVAAYTAAVNAAIAGQQSPAARDGGAQQ